jgi:hypothetical protein
VVATTYYGEPDAAILRCFSTRCDLCAVSPILPKLADKIERTGNENDILARSLCQRMLERVASINNHGGVRRKVACDFSQLRGGDGARGSRLRENNFGSQGK